MSAPAGRATLLLSSVAFASREVAVGEGESQVTFELVPTTQQLNEVVVTALGVTKNKKNLNYSTQTVETKDLVKARETNVGNSLSGKVAGLDVVDLHRVLVQTFVLVLVVTDLLRRLVKRLSLSTVSPGDLGSVNPDDIASMNVLKGSSARHYMVVTHPTERS